MRHHIDRFADEFAGNIASGDPDELLTTRQVARLLHVSVQWLEIGRCSGEGDRPAYGPPFVRINKRVVRYRRSDVVAWLRSRTEQPER